MQFPQVGTAYAATGIVSCLWWLRGASNRTLLALSGVIVAMGGLNAYVEGWGVLKQARPDYTVWFLLVVFALPYATLSVLLMEQMEGMSWRPAIWSSYLPIVCLLFFGSGLALTSVDPFENTPLALYAFTALVCILHVPAFAYGKGDVVRTMRGSGIPNAGASGLSPSVPKQAAIGLTVPLLANLGIQMATRQDWRPLCVSLALTTAIFSLFLISRK